MPKPKPMRIQKTNPKKSEDLDMYSVTFFQKIVRYLSPKFKQWRLQGPSLPNLPKSLPKVIPVKVEASVPKPQSVIFRNNLGRKGVARNLLLVLILLVIGVSVYFYDHYRQTTQDPQAALKAETDKLLAQISRITLIPAGETPTIATISNPDKLKNQPFFSEAQKGDKVLIYTNARKVFIYRPSIRKIINIAPLTVGGPSESNTPVPAPFLPH